MDNLIWVEDLIEEAGMPRSAAYALYSLPFAHLIDGELYYEPEPLAYFCKGRTATSPEEAVRNYRLMRKTTARHRDEDASRAEAQYAAARAVANKGRRRKKKPTVTRGH